MQSIEPWLWITLVVVNVPIYFGLALVLFGSIRGFLEALRYAITPDAWSYLKGEWADDTWASIKLGIWVIFCFGAVLGEAWLLDRFVLSGGATL